MNTQVVHKLFVIALVLVAFGLPFFIVRNQTSFGDNDDYLAAAVVRYGQAVIGQTNGDSNGPGAQLDSWATNTGVTFMGSVADTSR